MTALHHEIRAGHRVRAIVSCPLPGDAWTASLACLCCDDALHHFSLTVGIGSSAAEALVTAIDRALSMPTELVRTTLLELRAAALGWPKGWPGVVAADQGWS